MNILIYFINNVNYIIIKTIRIIIRIFHLI